MRVTGIDHFVLYATDVAATAAFYADTLDIADREPLDGRMALTFGDTKLNVHPAGDEIDPHAADPQPGAADFCLVVDEPAEEVADRLEAAEVDVIEGPIERAGARGPIRSVYVRDPDGNLVELANYPE
jgi:catechol 2,3-dioxygenase-like lactoylglutathione lyase family enzyme